MKLLVWLLSRLKSPPANRIEPDEPAIPAPTEDLNVVAVVKGEERYIVLFVDSQKTEAERTIGRWASNADLSFTWFDAANLAERIRNLTCQGK